MTFSLSILLYLYFVFLAVWLIFSLTAIYHMVKFGFVNFTTFFATFVFIGGAIFLLAQSYNYLSLIDWGMNAVIFEGVFNASKLYNFIN